MTRLPEAPPDSGERHAADAADGPRPEAERSGPRARARDATPRALKEALRKARKARSRDAHAPEWRQRLDAIVDDAVERVIDEGVQTRPDGRVDVVIDRKLAVSHGIPALTAVLDGVRDGLAGVGLPAAEPATAPLGAMTAALRHNLVGLVENVRAGLAGSPPPPRPVAAPDMAGPPPMPDARAVVEALLARALAAAPGSPPSASSPPPPDSVTSPPAGPSRDGGRAPPTVSLDLAGLFGSLLGGLQSATAAPPSPRPAAPSPSAPPEEEPHP
jgi:hypothetical protein